MKRALRLSTIVLLVTIGALGQRVMLKGTVYDPTGAVIPAVELAVTDTKKHNQLLKTNDKGEYSAQLEPGIYTLRFQSAGFKTLVYEKFRLVDTQSTTFSLDVVLEVGACNDCDDLVFREEVPILVAESKVLTDIQPRSSSKRPKKP
jgi:hypothetical protein